MTLPAQFKYLEGDVPKAVAEAVKLYGTLEKPGTADNPVIIGWADEIARLFPSPYNDWAGKFYADDDIPWCGLGHAIAHARAGRKPVDKYLSALEWRNFGVAAPRPMLGDTMVKKRAGGGHVTMYVGEDAGHYFCLGANQSDAFNIASYPKVGIDWTFRRPAYNNQPASVKVVMVGGGGAAGAGSEA